MALAKPVQLRSGETTRPAITLLIAQRCLTRPLDYLADLRQAGPRVSPAAIYPLISPVAGTAVRQNPLGVAIKPVPSRIRAGQGRAASIRLLSSLASSRWSDPFGGLGLSTRGTA